MAKLERVREGLSGRTTRKTMAEGADVSAHATLTGPRSHIAIMLHGLDSMERYVLTGTSEEMARLRDELDASLIRVARFTAEVAAHDGR